MKKHNVIIFAAFAVSCFCRTAGAWTSIGYWNSNEVVMRASAVSFPSGNSYRSALATVVNRFYNNPSEMWFTQQYDDTSVGLNNDQNEVWFTEDVNYSPAQAVISFSWWFPSRIVEADLIFYKYAGYTTSMYKTDLLGYGGSGDSRPFQTTAMHEYGHAAGLGHEDDEYNIMGRDWTHIHLNGSTCRSYLGEDASDGLVAIYGRASGGSFEDVSVSHWRWTGRSGEYSVHGLCRMFNSSGAQLSSAPFNGQRRYTVTRGQLVRPEFTYENNGETTKVADIGFYLSTNSYISTGDRLIGTGQVTLSRDDVYTSTNSYIYIPNDVTPGATYYLGVIIDYNNEIGEVDGSNNAAYHIIRIGRDWNYRRW